MQVPLAWGENPSSEQHSSAQAPNAAAACCTQGEQQRAQQGKPQREQQGKQQRQRRAAAVASSSSSRSNVRQSASGKINAQRGTAGRGELRSTTTVYDDVGRGEMLHHVRTMVQGGGIYDPQPYEERRAGPVVEGHVKYLLFVATIYLPTCLLLN